MKAVSKHRNLTIKVSTTFNGRPTSGWTADGQSFWRRVGPFEALYADASRVYPKERLTPYADDWVVTP